MGKDPAILFYTSDFLSGTITMTDEQIGKYMRLLCVQHQKGGYLKENDLLKICGGYDEDVFSKFVKKNDVFYNERMLEEIQKRMKYSESRRANRTKSMPKGKKHMLNTCKTYVKHMENENGNRNRDINTSKNINIIYPFGSDKFINAWKDWKDYKLAEFSFKYKSVKSEQIAVEQLKEFGENKAIENIYYSISKSWKGIYSKNGTDKIDNEKDSYLDAKYGNL